jgi:RHS repeat-associated protein
VFSYNARGRMSGAGFSLASFLDQRRPENDRRKPRLGVQYDINGLGERVVKHGAFVHPLGEVNYAYDEAGHLIGEYDARGNTIEETVYLGDLPAAVMDDTGFGFCFGAFGRSAASVHYINPDNIGAPHVITDTANRKVWQWNHEPFGNTEPVTATKGSGFFGGGLFGSLDSGFTYDLRFPGQIYDPETGLNYNMARDYNPALGRYAESDPIGLVGGVNTYGYVRQNPLKYIDPRGHQVWQPVLDRFVDWAIEDGPILEDELMAAWTRLQPTLYQGMQTISQSQWYSSFFGYETTSMGAEEVPELYTEGSNIAAQYGAMAAKLRDAYEQYNATHDTTSEPVGGSCAISGNGPR